MTTRVETTSMNAALSLDSDGNSTVKNVSKYFKFAVQAIFSYSVGQDAAGLMRLRASVDGVNFSDVPDSSLPFTSTTGNLVWSVSDEAAYPFIQVSVDNTSGVTPGATALVLFQGWYDE